MLAHLKIRKKVSIWFFFSLGGGKVMIISISESFFLLLPRQQGEDHPRATSFRQALLMGGESLLCLPLYREPTHYPHLTNHAAAIKCIATQWNTLLLLSSWKCVLCIRIYIIGRFCVFETKKWPGSKSPTPIKWKMSDDPIPSERAMA